MGSEAQQGAAASGQPFRVLFVCTGNICRSAQAEQVLRSRIPPELHGVVELSSAGTHALVGREMPREAADWSRRLGGLPDAHRGRLLDIEMLRDSDLVLGMAAEHRRAAVQLLPRASRHTFAFTEFVALVEDAARNLPSPVGDLGPEHPLTTRLRALVRATAGRRGFLPAEKADAIDVVDPYKQDDSTYERSAYQVQSGIDRMLDAVLDIARSTHRRG